MKKKYYVRDVLLVSFEDLRKLSSHKKAIDFWSLSVGTTVNIKFLGEPSPLSLRQHFL